MELSERGEWSGQRELRESGQKVVECSGQRKVIGVVTERGKCNSQRKMRRCQREINGAVRER